MKTASLSILVLFLAVSAQFASGQVTIEPGSFYTLSDSPADGGASGESGGIQFDMFSSFNVNSKAIRARTLTQPNAVAGEGVASSRIFYEFRVGSTPETVGQAVEGLITYSVDWGGQQLVITGGLSNAVVESELILRDMTTNANMYVRPVHNFDLETYKVRKVTLGLDYDDSGNTAGTFPAILRRGHTYRLTLRMAATVYLVSPLLSGSAVWSDYEAEGMELRSLGVMVQIDQKDLLRRLERVENHRHTYLTGRGEGHNNTEAVSSSPVIIDTKTQSPREDQPQKPR